MIYFYRGVNTVLFLVQYVKTHRRPTVYLHLLFWEEWPFVRGDVKAKCSPTMHLFSFSISVMTMTCAQKSNKKKLAAKCHLSLYLKIVFSRVFFPLRISNTGKNSNLSFKHSEVNCASICIDISRYMCVG